ncbi:MAG: hypothetical protein RR150_03380, partial [Clostridia bacterium]
PCNPCACARPNPCCERPYPPYDPCPRPMEGEVFCVRVLNRDGCGNLLVNARRAQNCLMGSDCSPCRLR